ncbi:hypothetical protein NPIL_122181 [Nephila pilipes]|uniref:Uncharacterized protein n=1 Tax=Nephila pilipes TaxID=299642 RepID=A0A8X6TPP7_NEPPI|nr:hypothetical protein NPIL_122181 [Nephila pilipes]
MMSVLHSKEFASNDQLVSIWFTFALGCGCFIAMSATGALVHEANECTLEKLKERISNKTSVTPSENQIMLTDASSVALTVWNIVPIKRSIIFGIFGAILTYCLLLDGLIKLND